MASDVVKSLPPSPSSPPRLLAAANRTGPSPASLARMPSVDSFSPATSRAFLSLGGGAGRPLLGRGDQGPSVARLQALLANAGFPPGESDGRFGAGTRHAVMRFQRSKDLEASGLVGDRTWTALENP